MKVRNDEIKRRRVLAGLSQGQLATAAGISQQALGQIEAGHTAPRPGTVKRIADALQVPTEELYEMEPAA